MAEQESEIAMLRSLAPQLDEEKKKNVEMAEQISKMSEELRVVQERVANAPEAAVKGL